MDKKVKVSLWIGGIAAMTALLTNERCREKMYNEMKQLKRCVTETVSFIRDNREQLFNQIQKTTTELSELIRTLTKDVRELSQAASQLKEDAHEVIDAAKEAVTEIKKLK